MRLANLFGGAVKICFGIGILYSSTVSDALAQRKFISIATAGVTGAYYPVGGTICRLINRESKQHNIRCVVEPTGGSIYNLNALRKGEYDVAFVQSDWQYNAYLGEGLFREVGADKNLRSLFSLYSEAFTIIADKNKVINSLDDLKGKKVNVGDVGSGTRSTMEELLRYKGWDTSIFTAATEFKPIEQAAKLCNKQIDAFMANTGHPNGLIQDVTANCGAKIVPVNDIAVDKLLKTLPYYARATIPGGMYVGNPNDVKTFGVLATVVASAETDDEMVYYLVKSVFDNFDSFKTAHPILSGLNKQNMLIDGRTAPLHDGAKRYYREVGLLKD
jgi:TRAP transporter TAXI family solute receptor